MRLLSRLHKILQKPFFLGSSAKDREERRLVIALGAARIRERWLLAAARRGEQVGERLGYIRREIEDLTARMPRGDTCTLLVLVFACAVMAVELATVHVWSPVALAALIGLVWYFQRRMQRRHARSLMSVAAVLVFLAAIIMGSLSAS